MLIFQFRNKDRGKYVACRAKGLFFSSCMPRGLWAEGGRRWGEGCRLAKKNIDALSGKHPCSLGEASMLSKQKPREAKQFLGGFWCSSCVCRRASGGYFLFLLSRKMDAKKLKASTPPQHAT